MFEKEAEEYANKNVPIDTFGFRSLDDVHYDVNQAYQQGAEFGYNKANEWHFVKNGDLPKYEEYVLIYTSLKNTYVARISTQKDYFITNKGGYVQMSSVIAWKEIVLPKEIKEK